MNPLTGRQRKHLRGLAHALEPVVMVGKERVTDAIVAQVDRALTSHELIKVRFVGGVEGRPEKSEVEAGVAELARRTGAAEAGRIGHIAILYRAHPEPEKRRIELAR